MKARTTIDKAGRMVIPKAMREHYGLTSGETVLVTEADEGLYISPAPSARKFVREDSVLAIDTGAGTAPLEAFDATAIREERLTRKAHAHRRR